MNRMTVEDSGISPEPIPAPTRPLPRSYRTYVDQQRRCLSMKCSKQDGCRLWRQMVLGFITTACVGLILLFLGSIFIADAIKENNSMAVMLCVMGIVCGGIIIMATIILGKMCKLCISSKSRNEDEAPFPQQQGACFHTCSVIYTRSTDQIPGVGVGELPPSYESVVHNTQVRTNTGTDINLQVLNSSTTAESHSHTIMVLPPKYDDVVAPLPPYKDIPDLSE
ncbi:uncharacterized protein LOC126811577 [Patella vulgata]|uniref:uncharacterized protein LOC126811577 n=1 Tax=Patella vulgata TaxID=6465 RepID=UPI00217F24A6|nr:uncharacterized protein LOC126811577 [Patella vulgata]